MSIPDFRQPVELLKKSDLPANSFMPISVSSTLPKADAKILRLKWKNLDEFVKWKLEEEHRTSVKLISGLTHNRAHGYALQTGTILYLCQHNTVVNGRNSCPCFLRVQLLLNTSGVTAQYNNRHSHETGGTKTNSAEISCSTVDTDRKGKKPIYEQRIRSVPTHSDIASIIQEQIDFGKYMQSTGYTAQPADIPRDGLPMISKSSANDALDHDSCGQYSLDIVKSIANLELKKGTADGQRSHISDVDLLRDRDVPQHNWALYGRSGPQFFSPGGFNSLPKSSFGVNETVIGSVPVGSTESDTAPVPYSSSSNNTIQNPGVSGAVNMSSPLPQPLGEHNTQRNFWATSWTAGPPLPAIDEKSSKNMFDSADRKRKTVDDGGANDDEQTGWKKVRNPWQYSSAGGDSSAFYGTSPASSSSSQTVDPWAFAQPSGIVNTEWITPAPDSSSGGQAIEYATSSWPAGSYGWGEAPWEKAFTATYNDELYPRYTSQDVAQEHIPSVYGADDVGCIDLAPQDNSSWVGYDAVHHNASGVGSNIHAQMNPFDAQNALPFPDIDSEINPFAYQVG